MTWKKLTPQEERVIVDKGTERAFTGEYWDSHADGTYTCKRCGAPLFRSDAKFDSGTGWPSFDSAIEGAVRQIPDKDGMRTEIVCGRCGAHLGHLFRGEGFTDKNVRHCVNSVSLEFASPEAPRAGAYFAGGCFWGVEHYFEHAPGVISAVSGYMGGHVANPTYQQVCSKKTGHVETVRITYDPTKTDYAALAKLFFEIHDPTQVDRQGPDVGEQYRSVVFYESEAEKKVAADLIAQLEARGFRVATRLERAAEFWPAEEYHQDYYERHGKKPYCHARVRRFDRPIVEKAL